MGIPIINEAIIIIIIFNPKSANEEPGSLVFVIKD